VPDGARFCPSCGYSVVPVNERLGDEERRIVTVLFADIVGFTTLSEQRDPEQVKRLVDAAFHRLVADVESHGGVVDKLLGDAIIALFGAPVAHEDDADRAVRAGLAMQATLRAFRDEHPADAVRMRIGINTGEVLVGTVAGSDYTAIGDVVNTASRLQGLAPPGAVLVGEATKDLCSAALKFQPYEDVQLRGREQFTQVWQAVALDTAVVTRRWQSDVGFVGRDVELGMLRAVTSIVRSGRSAIVAVAGEPGIGKSRLVHEVVTPLIEADPDTLVVEGSCAPYGESNVWWPIAGGILERLGLDRGSTGEEARRRVIRRLTPFAELKVGTQEFDRLVEVVLHLLEQPSALDDLSPAATRDTVFNGIVGGLRRRAEIAPVVVWIDDLQWAAPMLLELLESVARSLTGLPVLIITTYRPNEDDADEWPPPVDPALTLHLPLGPLSEVESEALVAEAAGRELSAEVVRRVYARSGGNPLFLIELSRLAAASTGAGDAELPGTLRALIASRLDQLTPGERAILDNAAIIGNEGRTASLREFAAEIGQDFDADDLRSLESSGLLIRDGSKWQFRSDVVREVAYSTLTKQSRAQRHAGVSRFLAANDESMIDRRAHHAAAAADIVAELGPVPGVPDGIRDEAVDLLSRAAKRWYLQGAHHRGLQLVERGLALVESGSDARRWLLLLLAEGLVDAHQLPQARKVLNELLALSDESGDRVTHGEVHRLRGTVEQMEGDLVAARRELGLAVAEFRELDDTVHLAESLRARGFAEIFGGSLTEADWFLGEADAAFQKTGNARGQAWVQQNRAWVSFLSGDHAESERRLTQAIDTFEKLDDPAGKNWSGGLLAFVYHFSRRTKQAEQLAASVLDEARTHGDEWGASMMLNLQASIRLWAGDIEQARVLAERSLAGFRKIDDRFGIIQSLSTLNRSYAGLGRLGDVDRSVEEILVLSDAFGEMAYPAIAAAGAAMHLGQGRRAAELATEAVSRLDTTGANIDEGRVVLAFGWLIAGEPEAALTKLLDVDVERSPFALAARATASMMIGDRAQALADARAVEQMQDVSYWDRAVAAIAGAAAATGEEALRRRSDLADTLHALTDVVLGAYGERVLTGLDGASPDSQVAIGGWSEVADRLIAVAVRV
jgi:class 3 adenylate cyclase/tetratricopeptide (TPR) repeat protein